MFYLHLYELNYTYVVMVREKGSFHISGSAYYTSTTFTSTMTIITGIIK